MDIASILGLAVGILVVVEMGGEPAELSQARILLLVLVGGLAGTLIAVPLRDALNAVGSLKKVFFAKPVSPSRLVERVVRLSETARAWGILRLEQAIREEDDDFLSEGVRLAVDGTEPELITDIMATELDYIAARHARAQRLWETLGRFWVLFGGVGALVVLAQQHGASGAVPVARAALPLLWGVLLYVLVAGPFARKLQACSEDEILVKRMTIEGVIGIQSGDNPRLVEHKLAAFMAPRYRPGEAESAAGPPPPPPADDRTREEVEAFARDKTGMVLDLVREAVEGHEADAEQKARVEASVARVDGGEMPLVALLAMLDQGVRDEIVRRIQHPPPRLVGPVPAQDLDFEDIGRLTGQDIQVLLREVDQRDLVIALKGASEALKEKILGCMSERVRTFISEEMGYTQVGPEVVLMMQARLVMLALELDLRGLIKTE